MAITGVDLAQGPDRTVARIEVRGVVEDWEREPGLCCPLCGTKSVWRRKGSTRMACAICSAGWFFRYRPRLARTALARARYKALRDVVAATR